MSLEQLRDYLQDYFVKPIVLRLQGTTTVLCPYCSKLHHHEHSGRAVAACDEDVRHAVGIIVGTRHFTPNWGYDIYEYRTRMDEASRVGVNELFIND